MVITTIKDVARHAQVSVATVSRVVNGLDRVSDKTRQKVQQAIEELNFVPNQMASSMITKQSQMLAVVVPAIENPFYTAVIQGTVEVAKREGYFTFVFSTEDSEQEEEAFFRGFLGTHVDGIVLIGAHRDPAFYRQIRKPIVLVDRYIENSGLDGVVIDNFQGAYEATRLLVDNGHERIAIVCGPQHFNDGRERFRGYVQALSEAGIPLRPEYQRHGDWFEKTGYTATTELMQLKEPPTALFAANNLLCQGTIKALRDLGLPIGSAVSLVGFDEHDLAEFSQPKVSVVRRPTREMGIQGTEMLIQQLRTKESRTVFAAPKKITLGVELLHRDSVKRLEHRG